MKLFRVPAENRIVKRKFKGINEFDKMRAYLYRPLANYFPNMYGDVLFLNCNV